MKIGIAGYGVVGQAQHSIIKDEVIIYDTDPKKCYDIEKAKEDILYTDFLFVCLPTPTVNGKQDRSYVEDFLVYLITKGYIGTVVIKSTVLLDEQFRDFEEYLDIVYNPEFLNQNSALTDIREQEVIILGGKYDSCERVKKFYNTGTNISRYGFKFMFVTPEEAMQFKYIRNIYNAYKVLFWEFVQDTTGNARKMYELYSHMKSGDMNQVGMDGFRGFGGACLPKDVTAWDSKHYHSLTDFMLSYNSDLNNFEKE